jgi:hypothetical protein
MNEILGKIYAKYLYLVVFIFSLLTTILVILNLYFYNKFEKIDIFQLLVFVSNFICILSFTILYIKSIENKKRNIIIFILIFSYYLASILGAIDLYFLKVNIFLSILVIFNLLNILLLYPLILIFGYYSSYVNQVILAGIILFFIFLINNIVIIKLSKLIILKNDRKYILLTLYYFLNNIISLSIIAFANTVGRYY